MQAEDAKGTESSTGLSEADGRPRVAHSLLHLLLGLPERSREQVRCRTSVPPVSFRYGAGPAAIIAQPGATSFAPPDTSANSGRDMAMPAVDAPAGSPDSAPPPVAPHQPNKTTAPSRANRQNDHLADQENTRQVADKPSRHQQQGAQQSDLKEKSTDAPTPAADDPAALQNTAPMRSILTEPHRDAPVTRAREQKRNHHVPVQENSRQAAARQPRHQQLHRQEREKSETLTEAAAPPAAPMVHRQAAQPEKGQAKEGNSRQDHGPSLPATEQQPAPKAEMQPLGNKEEISVPGFSPAKRLFPLLSSLVEETREAFEKPSVERVTASDAKSPEAAPAYFQAKEHSPQQPPAAPEVGLGEAARNVAFTRHLQQAPSADGIERKIDSAVAPGPANQTLPQEQNRRAPAAGNQSIPPVVTGHRQAQRHGAAAPMPASDDGEAFHRLEQLGQSFQQLLTKQLTGPGPKDEQPPRQEAAKKTQKPPVQHVVVIQRNNGGPQQKPTAAFWERSYLGRSHFNIIR